jgi:NADH dehydrogenase
MDNIMTAAGTIGVPLWGLISVVLIPVLSRKIPEWDAASMRRHFPELVGWIWYGALFGLAYQALTDAADLFFGRERAPTVPAARQKSRIVILGGGFAGMKTAECLEKLLKTKPSISITLVSETNALLFTPMLAEVAGSSLEPSHISTPLRTSLRRTHFIRARVTEVDAERHVVRLGEDTVDTSTFPLRELSFDHLVLALGSISNYLGLANLERLAFNFKSLLDAIRLRNHVIEMFERADREPDSLARRRLLTFVIAGGGFAGVEVAGALNDFAHGILADYTNLEPRDLRVVLVHSRERILPELSESLGRFAQSKMESRGVVFRLNARVADVVSGLVTLSDGEIASETLVWTAGTAPNPILRSLLAEKDKRGAVKVNAHLAVPGHSGVWALGDCAAVTDAKSGKPCPPTAQFALREASLLAENIVATLEGRPARQFHFDSLGALCVIGHQTACAELSVPFARHRSVRFSGFAAWFMWRAIYLAKLPGLERKIRVLVDWLIELFFPRDIVQTMDLK